MDKSAIIFSVQRFSLDDGPGIRTTFFLKGCNLRCEWCHNPESVFGGQEVLFDSQKCVLCGACRKVCAEEAHLMEKHGHVFLKNRCKGRFLCTAVCPAGALKISGEKMTVQEVVATAIKDRLFYEKSGGGVTFSGGEPLLQTDFLKDALMEIRKEGISTAVDTAGNVPWETMQEILPYTDLFLYDMKAWSPELHEKLTGRSNEQILSNLKKLHARGKKIVVRIPLVKGKNMDWNELKRMSHFLADLNGISRVELLPYHRYGEYKYEKTGKKCVCGSAQVPMEEELKAIEALFVSAGVPAVCRKTAV